MDKPDWWPEVLTWPGDEPWEVVVEPMGRWQWWINLRCGALSEFGRIVYGSRAHAEAVARRRLARQLREEAQSAAAVVIRRP